MYDKKINLLPTEQKNFLFQQKAKLGAIALGVTVVLGLGGFELYLMSLSGKVVMLTAEKSAVEQIKENVTVLKHEIDQQDQLIRILQNQDFPMDDFLLTLSTQIPKHLWLYSVDGEDYQVLDQCQNVNATQTASPNGATATNGASTTNGSATTNGTPTSTSGTSNSNCPPPSQSGSSAQPNTTASSGTTAQTGTTAQSGTTTQANTATNTSGQTTTQSQPSTTTTAQQTTTQPNANSTAGQTGQSTASNGNATAQNGQSANGQGGTGASAIQAIQNNVKAHKTFTIRGAGTSPTEIGQFVQILNSKTYIEKATLSSVEEYLANDQVYEAFEITVEGK